MDLIQSSESALEILLAKIGKIGRKQTPERINVADRNNP